VQKPGVVSLDSCDALSFMNPQNCYKSSSPGYMPYGAAEAPAKPASNRIPKRPGIQAALVCFVGPTVTYIVVSAVMSFSIHYTQPVIAWLIVGLAAAAVAVCGMLWYSRMRHSFSIGGGVHGPLWYAFFFFTMLAALLFGMFFGITNYWNLVLPSLQIDELMYYRDANPSTWKGEQLMDAGRVQFVSGSTLDVRKSIGFKNVDEFCVAPIINSAGPTPQTYDFWAIGVNCCSGSAADFHCGEYNNPLARSGLRLMREDHRAFYRLAVQQAEAAYKIRAEHPVFFYWMERPRDRLKQYSDDAVKYYFVGLMAFIPLQIFLVLVGIVVFSQFGT